MKKSVLVFTIALIAVMAFTGCAGTSGGSSASTGKSGGALQPPRLREQKDLRWKTEPTQFLSLSFPPAQNGVIIAKLQRII